MSDEELKTLTSLNNSIQRLTSAIEDLVKELKESPVSALSEQIEQLADTISKIKQ